MPTKTGRRSISRRADYRAELSPEERAERRAAGKAKTQAALDRLDAGIARLVEDDEAFAEYLRLSARMHNYSWGNRLLVFVQRPDAGLVAGFRAWRELGRPVVKGSKGIQILAPMVRVWDAGEENAGSFDSKSGELVGADGKVRRVIGYRVAYVFSVHDTDGPAVSLPRPFPPSDDSEAARHVFDLLAKRCLPLGVALDVRSGDPGLGCGSDGKPAGWYRPADRTITVNGDLPAAHRAKTLAHELAHHVAGRLGREDGEIVAEGAAFVVAGYFGLPTDGYSIPYIAGWAKDDIGRVRALLDSIARVADEILAGLEGCAECGHGEGCIHLMV